MKKSILYIGCILFFLSCSKSLVITKNIDEKFSDNILTYNLPKNEVFIKFEYEMTKISPSVFVQKKYNLLSDTTIIKELNNKFFTAYIKSDTVYKLNKVSFIEKTVPDSSKLYSIKVTNPKWFEPFKKLDYAIESNNSGILTSSEYTYDNYALDFTAEIGTSALQYLFKSKTKALNSDGKRILEEKDAKEEILKMIGKINKLEERRELLICDSIVGFDRKLLKTEISIIDGELKSLYSFLKGKKHSPIKKNRIVKYNSGKDTVFYFSKDFGFDKPYGDSILVSTFQYENLNKLSSKNYKDYLSSLESETRGGLVFNKPKLCEIIATYKGENLASTTTYIPQLGTIGYLNLNDLNHISHNVKLDPKTGALLKAQTKSSILSDPSKYGAAIAETIKGRDKKEDPPTPSDIDVQIAELEKKYKLLELQTKIDSLEAIKIDP